MISAKKDLLERLGAQRCVYCHQLGSFKHSEYIIKNVNERPIRCSVCNICYEDIIKYRPFYEAK